MKIREKLEERMLQWNPEKEGGKKKRKSRIVAKGEGKKSKGHLLVEDPSESQGGKRRKRRKYSKGRENWWW